MEIVVRNQVAGDVPQILDLFEKAFGTSVSEERWAWKYTHNPYRSPEASIGRDQSGALIAHFNIVPVRLNFFGTSIAGGQISDVMVDPQHHRQGYINRVGKHCFDRLPMEGYQLVYGFPNQLAFPTTLRPLGGRFVTNLRTYFRRLDIFQEARHLTGSFILGRAFGLAYRANLWLAYSLRRSISSRFLPRKCQFEIATRVPEGYSELWEANRSFEVLSVWKDAEYFRWRYDSKPGGEYRYFGLRSAQGLEALAVGTVVKGELQLLEFQIREKQVPLARHFLIELLRLALKEGYTKLVFKGFDNWFFDLAFQGFSRQVSYRSFFGVKEFKNSYSDYASLPSNWTLTFGDSDIP